MNGQHPLGPFQGTVPEVDIDWVEFQDWDQEATEDSRIHYLVNNKTGEFVIREPREKDDFMLPMPDRLPDLTLSCPSTIDVFFQNTQLVSPYVIHSKRWVKDGHTWLIHMTVQCHSTIPALSPNQTTLHLERQNTQWDVNNRKTYDEIHCLPIILSLEQIAFNHNLLHHDTDALNIRETINQPISLPEYVKNGQNKPAAYIRNRPVQIAVQFLVEPSTITSVKIKGISTDSFGSLESSLERTISFVNGISQDGQDDPITPHLDERQFAKLTLEGRTPSVIYASTES